MRATLQGYTLNLAPEWRAVPDRLADSEVASWALDEAERLCAAVPPSGRALNRPDLVACAEEQPEETLDPVMALAAEIAGVADAGAEYAGDAMRTVFLVRRPELGRTDATAGFVMRQDVTAESFIADFQSFVADHRDSVERAVEFRGDVPAGEVRGLHLVLATPTCDPLGAVRGLEERVVAGVFAPGCADIVEMVLVVNRVGSIPDLTQTAVDLLAGLDVDTAAVA